MRQEPLPPPPGPASLPPLSAGPVSLLALEVLKSTSHCEFPWTSAKRRRPTAQVPSSSRYRRREPHTLCPPARGQRTRRSPATVARHRSEPKPLRSPPHNSPPLHP